mmetsp:Transcript_8647/g.22347  ORF Transcript_8647/g.22347 Transcript_8647/m.22347 type:complete len:418 (+) Transcript_8647:244-1497(+)
MSRPPTGASVSCSRSSVMVATNSCLVSPASATSILPASAFVNSRYIFWSAESSTTLAKALGATLVISARNSLQVTRSLPSASSTAKTVLRSTASPFSSLSAASTRDRSSPPIGASVSSSLSIDKRCSNSSADSPASAKSIKPSSAAVNSLYIFGSSVSSIMRFLALATNDRRGAAAAAGWGSGAAAGAASSALSPSVAGDGSTFGSSAARPAIGLPGGGPAGSSASSVTTFAGLITVIGTSFSGCCVGAEKVADRGRDLTLRGIHTFAATKTVETSVMKMWNQKLWFVASSKGHPPLHRALIWLQLPSHPTTQPPQMSSPTQAVLMKKRPSRMCSDSSGCLLCAHAEVTSGGIAETISVPPRMSPEKVGSTSDTTAPTIAANASARHDHRTAAMFAMSSPVYHAFWAESTRLPSDEK